VCDGDRVLLVLRGQEPSRGKWSIPGGVVELGETVQEAAQREVMEECGLEVEVGQVIAVKDAIVRDEGDRIRFHYVLVDLAARCVVGELRPDSDISNARWVRQRDLTEYDLTDGLLPILRLGLAQSGGLDLSP
jgi:8-oxo-dGTP diphosphatase